MSYEVNNFKKADGQVEVKRIADAAIKNYDEQMKAYEDATRASDGEKDERSLVKHNSSSEEKKMAKSLPPNPL